MSRPLRIEYPNAWHHVMNRARREETLFKDKADYQQFIDIRQEATDLFNVNVAAFCLVSNHYHLLLNTPDTDTILSAMARNYRREPKALTGIHRGMLNEPRDVAIYLIRTMRLEPLQHIGTIFHLNRYSSVSSVVDREKIRILKDRKIENRVKKISEDMLKGQTKTCPPRSPSLTPTESVCNSLTTVPK